MGLKPNLHHEKFHTKTDLFILFRSTVGREAKKKHCKKSRRMKLRVGECVNDEMLRPTPLFASIYVDHIVPILKHFESKNRNGKVSRTLCQTLQSCRFIVIMILQILNYILENCVMITSTLVADSEN